MDSTIQSKLLQINQDFYKRFAGSFSETRYRVQPGVRKLIPQLTSSTSILDVGCGNGTLARALAAEGFQGSYLGLDMSQDLLKKADASFENPSVGEFKFFRVDLSHPEWHTTLPRTSFDWLTCFAVLHHIPGEELRGQTVHHFASLVPKNSRIAISVWQWQNSVRMKKRVLPWSTVGLEEEDLDEGDVLLDWRAGETIGLRYVHTFSEEELSKLAKNAGFDIIENFYSDGKSGKLALYQLWQLAKI